MRITNVLSVLLASLTLACCNGGCDDTTPSGTAPASASGVHKATPRVDVDPNTGLTVEQDNIKRRVENDNKPGAIKHLYLISPFTGDVLMYSAVKGKVTSGGKRLTPKSVAAGYASNGGGYSGSWYGSRVDIGGREFRTAEVLQDDGTYGDSSEYVYWWDTKGVYHQQGVEGALWHVSDQPLQVGKAKITIDGGT